MQQEPHVEGADETSIGMPHQAYSICQHEST